MLVILIVDDESEILDNLYELLSNAFQGEEYFFLKENFSRSAKEVLQTQPVDILLTDINMPGYNGFELSKIAKKNSPACKIIFLTGFSTFNYAYEAIKNECDDFIMKINAKDEIIAAVQKSVNEIKKETKDLELIQSAKRSLEMKKPNLDTEKNAVSFVKQYLWENLSKEISLNLLSRQVFLNPSYLSRIFGQETGISITEYLLNARIETAKKLLLNPELRIQDIAFQIGIDSPAYFSRLFRKATGCSPQEYRSLHYNQS